MSILDTSLGLVMGAVVSFISVTARERYRQLQDRVKDAREKLDRVIERLQTPHTVSDWHEELDIGAGQMIGLAICIRVAPELVELMQALRKALGHCRSRCGRPLQATCESCDVAQWAQENGCYVQAYFESLTPRVRVWRIASPFLWLERRLLRKPVIEMTEELTRVIESAMRTTRS